MYIEHVDEVYTNVIYKIITSLLLILDIYFNSVVLGV
jgi:hypothetical protein